MPTPPLSRREFLERMALAAIGGTIAATGVAAAAPTVQTLPRRLYGPRGVPLSIVGFGGILVMNVEQEHANRLVARAVERGVNYFDVAPTYGDAEVHLGPALEPYRKRCFLAAKTTQRTAEGARNDLAGSLARLRTDYLDLYQLHALTAIEKDVDAVFAKGGAMETLLEAKKQGQVRHLGFSAHSVEAAVAALDRYDFDSVLFPINFATFMQRDFGPALIAKAAAKKVSLLALKAFARQQWPAKDAPGRKLFPKCWYEPLTDPEEQALALRFTLGQPVVAALPPGEEPLFWRAVELAEAYQPLTEPEAARLRQLAATLKPIFGG